MPLLYFWRGDNYERDLDFGVGYHLNQANPLLHAIDRGDSLWAFTRRGDGAYVLAAELVVAAKTLNPPNYRYGRFASGAILCVPVTSPWPTSRISPFWCDHFQFLPAATYLDAHSRGLRRSVNSASKTTWP
jgi:hypothetical protein